ncbi:MAG: protein phosphatase 2C domain-containing protein [Myxococcales bacterium]|nr:protein phosphatase 2C domain-containing protein [Myxococcales bacterium]
MLHGDATFAIGDHHEICQDWAAAGTSPGGGWALVCDGCSSSPSSDFGARLLGRAASLALEAGCFEPRAVVAEAATHARALALPAAALDSTLVAVWEEDDRFIALVAGDGVVAARRRDGGLEHWSVELEASAPSYLSYLLDEHRLAAYLALHGARRVIHGRDDRPSERSDDRVTRARYGVSLVLPRADYSAVVVASDGARVVADAVGALSAGGAMRALMDFKTRKGRFLRRRLRRLLRKEHWQLGDDLGVAGLLEEAPS